MEADTVVIVAGVRTPITKARRGGLKDLKPDELLAGVLSELIRRSGQVEPNFVGDVCVGNVLQPGAGAAVVRMAMFEAGFSEAVPCHAVNRQCASGLQAVASIAGGISSGSYDIGIAAGVESMTHNSFAAATPIVNWEAVKACPGAADCLLPMGITSENVAKRFNISREVQDAFALQSHLKAARARETGLFKEEILTLGACEDDGIRPDTTLTALAKLKPAFAQGGTTTAGNSSQVSDGAAAVLLARYSIAQALQLPVMAVIRSYVVTGVPPDIMGVGPAFSIPEAVRKAGLALNDIDFFEINEAFASQCQFCVQYLGIPPEKVNPLGGAIALGHPLGCSGVRLVVTLTHHLKRTGKRYGCVSLCVGTGMGAAMVVENIASDVPPPRSRL